MGNCLSIMVQNIVNSVGARMHPCFMPFSIVKGCKRSLLCLTWMSWFSWSWMTMVRSFGQNPCFSRIFQSPVLLIVLNALVRSMKVTCRPFFYFQHFSWICLKAKTMLLVTQSNLKPHWLYERYYLWWQEPVFSMVALQGFCQHLTAWLFHNSWNSLICHPCSYTGLRWMHCGNLEVLYLIPNKT